MGSTTVTPGGGLGNLAGLGAIMAFGMTFIIILGIVFYVLYTLPFYKLYKKADHPNAWLAFVPIAQMWPLMATIGKSAWNILWLLLPAVGDGLFMSMHNATGGIIAAILSLVSAIIVITWYVKLFRVFGMSPLWLLLWIAFIIPVLNFLAEIGFLVVLYVMAFNDKYQYRPFDPSVSGI